MRQAVLEVIEKLETRITQLQNELNDALEVKDFHTSRTLRTELNGLKYGLDLLKPCVIRPTAKTVKWIKKAGEYLIPEENTIIEMVTAIKNNQNQEELIDYIPCVVVWQKVEFEFNCRDFLKLIGYE